MSTQAIRDALAAGPTGGVWRKGTTGGAVVSDQHVEHGPNDCDCVNYYGGHLIAESVASRNLDFIAACNPAAIAALLKELDAAKADAERYRWLCSHPILPAPSLWTSGVGFVVEEIKRTSSQLSKDNLDAAIDAALTPSIGEQG